MFKKAKKKTAVKWQSEERGVRRCDRNNSSDIKVSEERGGGGAQDAGAETLPLLLMIHK